jgi:hypothetical protein
MVRRGRPVAVLFLACFLFGACGSDSSPDATAANGTVADATADSAAPDASGTSDTVGTNIDCAALKDAMANLSVNWQVIIGLANVPTSEWATVPLGHLEDFPAQLVVVGGALGKNLQAAGALQYMSDAYDIVQRGLDGDTNAQADLAAYLGPDATVNVNKQIPIVLAYTNAGCD